MTTAQAVYMASPAGVLFGAWLLGERIDVRLIVCLSLLLLALYLNSRALAAARPANAS